MKFIKLLLLLPLFTFLILSESCKKDEKQEPVTLIEQMNLAGDMMTLSAIAYIAGDQSNDVIKDSIQYYLNDTSLTTKGNWKLVWGPGISEFNTNLSYIVKNESTTPEAYAVVIRGTNINSVFDILEDLNVFKMAHFPYGQTEDSTCKGAMDGFNNLLGSTDDVTGTTMETYLTSLPTTSKVPLFVTGHSQGGGLAPMIAYWIITKNEFREKFECATYAFAGPGWFNKSFKENFINALAQEYHFKMMVNSLDMIPYGYANLPGINSRNIPVHVPFPYRVLIGSVDSILSAEKLTYYNIAVADTIGSIPITASTPGGLTPADTISWYNHWLGVEHSHNSYLKLLNAVPFD